MNSVTPCPIEPCELHKGSNYSIAVHFDEDIEDELSLSLCGYIGPVCVPFPTDTPKQKSMHFFVTSNFSKYSKVKYCCPTCKAILRVRIILTSLKCLKLSRAKTPSN